MTKCASWGTPVFVLTKATGWNTGIVEDDAISETILEIEMREQRGVGYCKSTTGLVRPFEQMVERIQPVPTDRLFPVGHKTQINQILERCDLKVDRQGNRADSIRCATANILFRLLEETERKAGRRTVVEGSPVVRKTCINANFTGPAAENFHSRLCRKCLLHQFQLVKRRAGTLGGQG